MKKSRRVAYCIIYAPEVEDHFKALTARDVTTVLDSVHR
jgi:hypothetical protein